MKKRKIYKKILVLALCLISTFSMPLTTLAKTNTNSNNSEITPMLALDYHETPPCGYTSSQYNIHYNTTSLRNYTLEQNLIEISKNVLAGVLCYITGLSATKLQALASTFLSYAITHDWANTNKLYYRIVIFQHETDPFNMQYIYAFYTDSACTRYLGSKTVYVTKSYLAG